MGCSQRRKGLELLSKPGQARAWPLIHSNTRKVHHVKNSRLYRLRRSINH